jgi:hypothetical protein
MNIGPILTTRKAQTDSRNARKQGKKVTHVHEHQRARRLQPEKTHKAERHHSAYID